MEKEFNEMTEKEKTDIYTQAEFKGKFDTDFAVGGRNFSEMTAKEKTIVYMQIVAGEEEITRDVNKYDPTTVVISDEDYIINKTPYGIIGVSNKLSS